MAFLALHGFGSSPRSRKNLALAGAFARCGQFLHRPDLNQPSFAALSFAAMLGELDRIDRAVGPSGWSIVGSSLGGYVAALWAVRRPERVERLVLLCPAFELAQRWTTLLPSEEFAAWRATGRHAFVDADGRSVPLHYAFVEEAMRLEPMPQPRCPVRVVHGRQDARVPIEGSRRFVAADPSRRSLVERDDGHDLTGDLDGLCHEVLDFFEVRR